MGSNTFEVHGTMHSNPYGTTRSNIPFFGRAYSLTITPKKGPLADVPIIVSSDEFEPNALRFTFDCVQFCYAAMWQAEITIYNCDGPIGSGPFKGVDLYQAVIQEGDEVTVCAGYQADYPPPATPPVIWSGQIFYTIQDRVDVVDRRLILHCLLARQKTFQNFLNTGVNAMSTQFDQAREIAAAANNPIVYDQTNFVRCISNSPTQLGAQQLPRGKTYFGRPDVYLDAIAEQNGLVSWYSDKWEVDGLGIPTQTAIKATYAPVIARGQNPARVIGTDGRPVSLTLVGQPQQTQLGVTFRVLLDPTIQIMPPLPRVVVKRQFIRQATVTYPLQPGPPRPIPKDEDGYVVVGVRFIGDTRGNDWHTEITGVVVVTDAIALVGQSLRHDPTQD